MEKACVLLLVLSEIVLSQNLIRDTRNDRIRGIRNDTEKDFVIGALFAVHRPLDGSGGSQCGTSLIHSGVERLEAFYYALDMINRDPDLLPGINLGYDVRDTCVSETIALDESAEQLFGFSIAETDREQPENSTMAVTALIGPTTSQVSLVVASFLRLFKTPEVSYSVSSPIFNNRNRYGYFYRTHPSDGQEVQAMVDIIIEFGWTNVIVMHSDNAYGESAAEVFRNLAEKKICITMDIGLDEHSTPEQHKETAHKIFNQSLSDVIVLYASLHDVVRFMEEYSNVYSESTRHFTWLASSSWFQSQSIIQNYSKILTGMLGLEPLTNNESNYSSYFSGLMVDSNSRNPWFKEYYDSFFDCNADCYVNQSITSHPDYFERTTIQFVIDAVYSVAHALDDFLQKNCDLPIVWDPFTATCVRGESMSQQLNGSVLRDHLQSVNFTSLSGNEIVFNKNGNVDGNYHVLNYQMNKAGAHEYVQIGSWSDSAQDVNRRLHLLNESVLQFGINRTMGLNMTMKILTVRNSNCKQCPPGHIDVEIESSCCGTCDPCTGMNFLNSSYSTKQCDVCPQNYWGNRPLTGSHFCQPIKKTYIGAANGFGTFLVIVAIVGLLCVTVVSVLMGIFWKDPIIKSSGREQMILLLVGVGLSLLVTIFFIVPPSVFVCTMQRISTWFCFSLILSALFIKLLRIARIFMRSNQISRRPRFIQSKYQVIFTFCLVSVQMVLVAISLAVAHPEATYKSVSNVENTLGTPTLVAQCSSPSTSVLVIQILVYTALLIATNVLAIMTVRFPENFNEARYVACATFSTLLIWFSFLQTYFAVNESYRNAIISFAIQLTSLAVLFCLFVPRLFTILFRPFSNNQKKTHSSSQPTGNFSTSLTKINGRPSAVHKNSKDDEDCKDEIKSKQVEALNRIALSTEV